MENVMNFSEIFGGATLGSTVRELAKPMKTGLGNLLKAEVRVNEKNGMPNVQFIFGSIIDDSRTVTDYIRTSSGKDCYKSVHRLKYLAELAGKPELFAKIPPFISIVHSFTSENEGDNAGILTSKSEELKDKTLSIMFLSEIAELKDLTKATLEKMNIHGSMLIVKSVNQEAVCKAFAEIGAELIGQKYMLTIEANDRGFATIKKYQKA